MAKVITFSIYKGGTGKTTSAVNTAAALAEAGKRVLLIDLDPQGNATMGVGINKTTLSYTVYHVLLGLANIKDVCQRAACQFFDILPANRELAGAEIEMIGFDKREYRLKEALEKRSGCTVTWRDDRVNGETIFTFYDNKTNQFVPVDPKVFKNIELLTGHQSQFKWQEKPKSQPASQ